MNLKKIMLLRWYTIPSWALIATIAYVNIRGKLNLTEELVAVQSIAVLFWISLILLLEKFHEKIDGRPRIEKIWTYGVLAITSLALTILEPLALVVWGVMILALWIYSKKAVGKNSSFVFFTRGLQEVGVYIAIVVILTHNFQEVFANVNLLVAIYLATTARNMIGDIRDTQFDYYTLPVIYGKKMAYGLSAICSIAAIIIAPAIITTIPLIVMAVLTVLQINAYKLHETYVISTSAFLANILSESINGNMILMSLFFAAALTASTYELVQRKSNVMYFKEREKYENSKEE